MKTLVLAVCASLCFAGPAFAQSPDAAPPPADQGAGPGPDAGAGPDAGGGPAAGGGGKGGKMKELMQSCREQTKGQGLKGKDRQQAISDCVVKQNPKMAGRMKCRMEGVDKGLKKDELKSYVQSCMKGGN